jgi:DNA-binding TFAR19-related protein (PDSD5 family)
VADKMADDDDFQAIRSKRLAELQSQYGGDKVRYNNNNYNKFCVQLNFICKNKNCHFNLILKVFY